MRSKTEERREAILRAATEAFTEKGIEQTSMNDIVTRTGGSKATLYNYFPSKATLLHAVLFEHSVRRFEAAFDVLKQSGPLAETLCEFGCVYLQALLAKQTIAVRRMAQQDADRSDVGRHFYFQSQAIGWEERMPQMLRGRPELVLDDDVLAAVQFRALLVAPWLDRRMFGVIGEVTQDDIAVSAKDAVRAFLKLYGR